MNAPFAAAADAFDRLAADATARFGALTPAQLNWAPEPGRWSVAQCLDHLVVTNGLYRPRLARLAAGDRSMSVWERVSPLSGVFGRLMRRMMQPDAPRAVRTRPHLAPSSSALPADTVARFADHLADLAAHVRRLPPDLDADRLVVTSPVAPVVTYSLADALAVLDLHGQRHLAQARRVTEAPGFPRG